MKQKQCESISYIYIQFFFYISQLKIRLYEHISEPLSTEKQSPEKPLLKHQSFSTFIIRCEGG
jgi:hypothetical protein